MAAVQQLLSPPQPPPGPMFQQLGNNEPLPNGWNSSKATTQAVNAAVSDNSLAQDMPQQGDSRIIVVLHNTGQERILSVFAEILGRPCSSKASLRDISTQDANHVLGVEADHAFASLASRDPHLYVAINAHCVSVGMPPKPELSASCDYEFLYEESPMLRRDLARFISFVLGQSSQHDQLMSKARTHFISTTFPDVRAALPNIDILTVGSDAIEIRVDLLQEPLDGGKTAVIPSLAYVGEQVMLLRQRTELPIIFTIRSTDFSNGRFPMDDPELYYKYLSSAIQWGLEYVDVELWLPDEIRKRLYEQRGQSRILSAFHDFSGSFRWSSTYAHDVFCRSMEYADIIKMIAIVNDQSANFELEYFRSLMQEKHPAAPPFSGVNMGETGQLSRALNKVFTPVTHPLLPIVAAPGQLSTAQINQSLALLGQMPSKTLYGINSLAKAPLMQASFFEKCLNELGLPHRFLSVRRQSKSGGDDLDYWCSRPDFGGAYLHPGSALTLLTDRCARFRELRDRSGLVFSSAVQAIGIVDTIIVKEPSSCATSTRASRATSPQDGSIGELAGVGRDDYGGIIFDNVTWRGVLRTLTRDLAPSAYFHRPAIVLASSSDDAAPCLLAMKALRISRVYTVGFKSPEALAHIAPPIEPVATLQSLQRARSVDDDAPFLIVSSLGSEMSNLVAMVVRAFGAAQLSAGIRARRVFLDLADHKEGNGALLSRAAEQSGFAAYGAADVAAFATVESLRLLVGQNVPYSFVRLANGNLSLDERW